MRTSLLALAVAALTATATAEWDGNLVCKKLGGAKCTKMCGTVRHQMPKANGRSLAAALAKTNQGSAKKELIITQMVRVTVALIMETSHA